MNHIYHFTFAYLTFIYPVRLVIGHLLFSATSDKYVSVVPVFLQIQIWLLWLTWPPRSKSGPLGENKSQRLRTRVRIHVYIFNRSHPAASVERLMKLNPNVCQKSIFERDIYAVMIHLRSDLLFVNMQCPFPYHLTHVGVFSLCIYKAHDVTLCPNNAITLHRGMITFRSTCRPWGINTLDCEC